MMLARRGSAGKASPNRPEPQSGDTFTRDGSHGLSRRIHIVCLHGGHIHENPDSLRLQHKGTPPADTYAGETSVLPSRDCSKPWGRHTRRWWHQQPRAPALGASIEFDNCTTDARPEGKLIPPRQRTNQWLRMAGRVRSDQREPVTGGRRQKIYRAARESSR